MRRSRRRCLLLSTFLALWSLGAFILFTILTKEPAQSPAVSPSRRLLRHRLAVLVPFRDRYLELSFFVPYMRTFLSAQNIDHQLFIIHQTDGYRFNRASLINVGFKETSKDFDYLAIHDVDLLPVNPNISYAYPARGPMHLTSPKLHPRYHYKKFLGGILLITREQFQAAGGMSNLFWGWGREDDEFRLRLLQNGMQILTPQNISTGYKTFRHIHNRQLRPRDGRLYYNQKELTFRRDVETGVDSVAYRLRRRYQLTIEGISATVLDVELNCDLDWTPYCQFPKR